MSRRRRAALLLGLALALGGLAASDVARREGAVERRLGPLVAVLVARRDLPAGAALTPERLAVRRVPARFVPPAVFSRAGQLAGLRARAALPAGAYLTATVVRDPDAEGGAAGVRPGERVAELVATGDPRRIAPGGRVDVLVTRDGAGEAPGRTSLALQDVEVLDARPAPAGDRTPDDAPPGERVAVSLRVTLRQAVYLTAAQSFAREIRLLPRAPGDRGRGAGGTSVDGALR